MPKPEKIEAVNELRERIADSQICVLTKYVGINAEQATSLRAKLRGQSVRYKVYKNTLAKRVLDELGLGAAASFMDGPTGWAFSKDPVTPAKILRDFNKETPKVEMLGGVLEGRVITAKQLQALADLPPREVLLSQVVGTIAAPMQNLVGALSALPRNLVNVLDQVKKQKEGGAAA